MGKERGKERKKKNIYPNKSSSPELPVFGACCDDCWEGAGEESPEDGAPQIPALAFSFAMLAKFGPLLALDEDF